MKLRLRVVVALALLVAAVAATQAPAAASAPAGTGDRVLFAANCRTPVFKPKRIIVTCADANFVVQGINWSSWTSVRATGRGVARVNDCNPSCAAGTFRSYPVRVTLSRPTLCRSGLTQFVRIAVRFTAEKPHGFPRVDRFRYGCGIS